MIFHHCRSCDRVAEHYEFAERAVTDPFCTGDSPDEVWLICLKCGSEDVDADVVVCDGCEAALPLDGYEDCAECIKTGRHAHTRDYGTMPGSLKDDWPPKGVDFGGGQT